MSAAKTKKLSDAEWAQEFAGVFRELSNDVREWALSTPGWEFHEGSEYAEQKHRPFGNAFEIVVPPFRAPRSKDEWNAPHLHAGGLLILEPRGRDGAGRAVVLLYAWPTFYQVRLLHQPQTNTWQVLTDSGIPWRREWNRDNFVLLVHDLLAAGK